MELLTPGFYFDLMVDMQEKIISGKCPYRKIFDKLKDDFLGPPKSIDELDEN